MEEIKKADTIGEKQRLESLHGTRYSVLTELPYVDLIKMAVVDPMHNLFLGMSSFNKLNDLRYYGASCNARATLLYAKRHITFFHRYYLNKVRATKTPCKSFFQKGIMITIHFMIFFCCRVFSVF